MANDVMKGVEKVEPHNYYALWVTASVGTFIPIITLIGYLLTVSSNKKQRIIATVNAERIEWINKLRDEFVRFNTSCLKYSMINYPDQKGQNVNYDVSEEYTNVISSQNHINLLMNPKELIAEELIFEIDLMANVILGTFFDMKKYKFHRERINDLQQIILKAEWQRIREESASGKHINSDEMEVILKSMAVKINRDLYEEIVTNKG